MTSRAPSPLAAQSSAEGVNASTSSKLSMLGAPAVLEAAGQIVLQLNRPGLTQRGADRLLERDCGVVVGDGIREVAGVSFIGEPPLRRPLR
jgi:hypothetical protein